MKKIFLSILLLSAVLFPSRTLATTGTCQASDSVTAKDCFNKINSGQVDTVEVTTPITCSGPNACAFSLNNINRPISIYGAPNTNAGFTITDSNNYSILTVNNSSQVTISNLIFNDTSGYHCPKSFVPNSCFVSPIAFLGGTNNVIDGITIENSKYAGLYISGSNLTITNSKFINNSWMGIEINQINSFWGQIVGSSPILHIENNLFQDNAWPAIDGSFSGTADNPSTIRNNILINNYREYLVDICGSGHDPCGGAQLVLEPPGEEYVIIDHNTIKDGSLSIPKYNTTTTGIELSGNISNVTIQNNDIHNNTGAGIFWDACMYKELYGCDVSNLNILNNMLYNNGWANIYPPPGANISGNCESAGCNPNAGVIILSPIIYKTTQYFTSEPWKILVWGGNLSSNIKAQLFDVDGVTRWGGDLPADYGTDGVYQWVGVTLPGTYPPSSKCNLYFTTCAVFVRLLDTSTNLLSNTVSFVLPLVTPTAKPSPSPTPTPTPKPFIPGDLDKNGKIDIFDYNLMIQNFGNTTCGNVADIDGNCKVDIFDYNILVGSFGKTQ